MSELPFISVVVPVWNSPELIATCLQALEAQDYPAERFEVIVVDNGSTDRTAEVVRGFGFASLASEPRPGSYRARNAGLAHAIGAFVAFTDADCIPGPGWLSAAAEATRVHPDAGIFGGAIRMFQTEAGGHRAVANLESLFSLNQSILNAKGHCVTANWMSPRALLMELGGFRADLRSLGDMEFSGRIVAAGHRIQHVPDMVVRHPVRGNLGEMVQKRRRIAGGQWASRKSRLSIFRFLASIGLDCASKLARTAVAKPFSARDRLGVAGVVLLLSSVGMAELLRVACGGEPRRA